MAKLGYETFKTYTPVKSGYAKSHTSLSGNKIMADYAYAVPLDNGYSKQSPSGMTVPMIQVLREHVRRQLGYDLNRGLPSAVITNNRSLKGNQQQTKIQAFNQRNTGAFVKSGISGTV